MLNKKAQIFAASILHVIVKIYLLFHTYWKILIRTTKICSSLLTFFKSAYCYFSSVQQSSPGLNGNDRLFLLHKGLCFLWKTNYRFSYFLPCLYEGGDMNIFAWASFHILSHTLVVLTACFVIALACLTHLRSTGAWNYLKGYYEIHNRSVKKMHWGMRYGDKASVTLWHGTVYSKLHHLT